MPSIERNKARWSTFGWDQSGDEWSQGWGESRRQWHATVWPRIGAHLPAPTILEIAPGHGRITQFLADECDRLVLVDLVPECIERCRERFADRDSIEYHVNDGTSLPMLGDQSIDFAMSWDSLVHASRRVLASYLKELARVLKPGGAAFLHHSNMRALRHPITGVLSERNRHWRSKSVCAEIVRRDARTAGLHCLVQEQIAWGGEVLNDCFSLLRRPDGEEAPQPIVIENHMFESEVTIARRVGAAYSASPVLREGEGANRNGTQTALWEPNK